jgi:gas vesicle protein GvpA/GvpJ/GvpM family
MDDFHGSNVAAFSARSRELRMKIDRTATIVPAERPSTQASVIDIFDHVLDKGIIIDARVRVAVAGIDLITVDARIVVASIETYLERSPAIAQAPAVSTDYRLKSVADKTAQLKRR